MRSAKYAAQVAACGDEALQVGLPPPSGWMLRLPLKIALPGDWSACHSEAVVLCPFTKACLEKMSTGRPGAWCPAGEWLRSWSGFGRVDDPQVPLDETGGAKSVAGRDDDL